MDTTESADIQNVNVYDGDNKIAQQAEGVFLLLFIIFWWVTNFEQG